MQNPTSMKDPRFAVRLETQKKLYNRFFSFNRELSEA